jgi:hypothetical protein
MAHVGPAPVTATRAATSYIEWAPVFAGAVIAAALSFVFLAFGTATGFSLTSPWPGSGLSAKTLAYVSVFFVMVQQIGAFLVGGYVAGRMRSRLADISKDEGDFRDGLHGGLVWAVGVAVGAALFFATVGASARTVANAAGPAAGAVANQAMDSTIDGMLRPVVAGPPAAAQPGGPAAQPAAATARTPATNMEVRAEIGRMLAASAADGSISGPNRTYLAQLISQRTGLPQAEAEKRVDEAVNQARAAADKARRATALAGFVTAASLLISFAAAWWAAVKGGNHRDNNVAARFDFVRPIRRPNLPG